jgi:hypothetical protein
LNPATVHSAAAVAVVTVVQVLAHMAVVAAADITAAVEPETLAAVAVRQIMLRLGLVEA